MKIRNIEIFFQEQSGRFDKSPRKVIIYKGLIRYTDFDKTNLSELPKQFSVEFYSGMEEQYPTHKFNLKIPHFNYSAHYQPTIYARLTWFQMIKLKLMFNVYWFQQLEHIRIWVPLIVGTSVAVYGLWQSRNWHNIEQEQHIAKQRTDKLSSGVDSLRLLYPKVYQLKKSIDSLKYK